MIYAMLHEDYSCFKNILEESKTKLNYPEMEAIIYNLKISG